MKIRYLNLDVADCTSDPHYVSYDAASKAKMLEAMLDDVLKVCKSEHIQNIRSVTGRIGDTRYVSDHYSNSDWMKKGKGPMKGKDAEHARINGLYYSGPASDSVDDDEEFKELPSGLNGVKRFIEEAKKDPENFQGLSIGVIWTFAGDHSCSDYIEVGDMIDWSPGSDVVNFGCQDWWVGKEGYYEWCDAMEEFLGKEFPRS